MTEGHAFDPPLKARLTKRIAKGQHGASRDYMACECILIYEMQRQTLRRESVNGFDRAISIHVEYFCRDIYGQPLAVTADYLALDQAARFAES